MKSDDRAKLITAAIDQSDQPIVLTTADLDQPGPAIVTVNDAYSQLTGYTPGELIGATPRMLQGPATDRVELDRLKTVVQAGIMFEGATWNYRKDGTAYRMEWTVAPLRLPDGTIDYLFSIQRDITDRRPEPVVPMQYLETSLHAVSNHSDPVTGAQTRQSMLRCLQRAIDASVESAIVTGLIKLQLKRLDRLNKVFNLAEVNRLLWRVAERLAHATTVNETLARPHEYTLAVTIPVPATQTNDADEYLVARAEALQAAITAKEFTIADETLAIEIGVGVGRAPIDGQDANDLAVLVDAAAQGASYSANQIIRWVDHGVVEHEHHQFNLERNLRQAISEDELVVHYQPIVDLSRNQIVGAEALARWPQPVGQPSVGPDEFIPLAESLGLINRLSRRVFEQVCRQLHQWQKHSGNASFWVSINISPKQLADPNLADRLLALAQSMGVAPACLKLEITENALEEDFQTAQAVIDDLVAAGFRLALDDFGKGHSSLERVIALPFSVLKVDRSFVWQAPDGPGAGVVSSLVELSNHLKLEALGEGVETPAHEAFLQECGYAYAQGYYYGKPVAGEDFPAISKPLDQVDAAN